MHYRHLTYWPSAFSLLGVPGISAHSHTAEWELPLTAIAQHWDSAMPCTANVREYQNLKYSFYWTPFIFIYPIITFNAHQWGQRDDSVRKGACRRRQAQRPELHPCYPTWWEEKTDSHERSSDLGVHAVAQMKAIKWTGTSWGHPCSHIWSLVSVIFVQAQRHRICCFQGWRGRLAQLVECFLSMYKSPVQFPATRTLGTVVAHL